MMDNKPYRNKPDYDPGRFRYTISFNSQIAVKNPSGGTSVFSNAPLKVVKAIKLPVNDGGQLEINAGATSMNQDTWFVVRVFSDFQPDKNMLVEYEGRKHTLQAIIPQGEPVKYWKLLCTYANDQDLGA